MGELETRMECLRLAVSQNYAWSQMAVPPSDIKSDIDLALEYYKFVRGGPSNSAPLKAAA